MKAAGLLAALGAILASPLGEGRGRAKSRRNAPRERRAQMKHAARLSRWRELAWRAGQGPGALTDEERVQYDRLRLQRGRLSRRMARAKVHGIGKTRRKIRDRRGGKPPAAAPLRLGHRVPRQVRALLLRQQQLPPTGRQWKKLRKAARRQERAS